MGVKISFTDFPSIYENLTFKSRANESIRWFCILSFGSIWPSFEVRRRSFYAPLFFACTKKNYGDSYCQKIKKPPFSQHLAWIQKLGHMEPFGGTKTPKLMIETFFFNINNYLKSPFMCVWKLSQTLWLRFNCFIVF